MICWTHSKLMNLDLSFCLLVSRFPSFFWVSHSDLFPTMSVLQSVHQDNLHLHLLLFFSPFTFCLSRLVPKFLSKRATSFSSLAFVAAVDSIIIVSCSLQIKVGLLSCTNLLVCSQNQSVHMFIVL